MSVYASCDTSAQRPATMAMAELPRARMYKLARAQQGEPTGEYQLNAFYMYNFIVRGGVRRQLRWAARAHISK